jgi:putative intracellular protease/amidase
MIISCVITGCAADQDPQDLLTTTDIPTVTKTIIPATATHTRQPTNTLTPEPSSTPTQIPSKTSTLTKTPGPRMKTYPGVNALLILPDQYGANYYLNKDDFEELGWNITIAGVKKHITPCASFAELQKCRNVTADVLISEVEDISNYDVLAIMQSTQFSFTGPPYGDLLESRKTLELIASANDDGLVIFAPCIGVKVLAAAGILDGVDVTGKITYKNDYEEAGANYLGAPHSPVIDGNIVTGVRGLYYHVQISEAIATALENAWVENAADPLPSAESNQVQATDQEGVVWAKTIGGAQSDGGRDIIETNDGGFVIAGYTFSFGAGNADASLVKVDAEGELIWSKTFGGAGWEYAYAVGETKDGGFILGGYTTSNGAGQKDILLVRTDPDGNEIWAKTYGGPGIDVGRRVLQTKDGGFILVGYTTSIGLGESDVYLLKTDPNGNEIWAKTFGDTGPDRGHDLDLTFDEGYIITGASGSFSGNSDAYLIKVNTNGVEEWSKTFSLEGINLLSESYDWANAVKTTQDGGFIIIGNSDSNEDLMNIHLIKTDSEGEIIWTQTFGKKFYDYGSSVSETGDGGFILSGATKNASTGHNDIYLRKVDQDGNEVWTQIFGTVDGSEWGSSVIETRNGHFIIAGHTNSYGAGLYDIWLLRVAGNIDFNQ